MINVLVVTHGEFGAYLVEAAEAIVGSQRGVATVAISARLPMNEVRRRIAEEAKALSNGDGLVIAIDMPGGTPCNISMPLAKDNEKIAVVSGVNLYMLITAFNGRRQDTLEKLVAKMLDAGRRSVADVKAVFSAKAASGS